MASPESIAAAFAKGMMEAMLAQPDAAAKKEKPKVIKTDDVRRAVAETLPTLLAQMAGEPEQQDLFQEPGVVDVGDALYQRRLDEAQARADAQRDRDEMPENTFDPNVPGAMPWTSAAR